MTVSIIRFWQKGWIQTLYLDPSFHFSYYGFEWVKPIGEYTYLIFLVCAISAFMVAIGYKYYLSIIIFFLSFTYIELMDKTTYLNHYYFISILSFLMIFLPCNARFSVDSLIYKKKYIHQIVKLSNTCKIIRYPSLKLQVLLKPNIQKYYKWKYSIERHGRIFIIGPTKGLFFYRWIRENFWMYPDIPPAYNYLTQIDSGTKHPVQDHRSIPFLPPNM